MDFGQTVDFLYSRLPIFQRSGKVAFKPDLSRTIKLLGALEDPHLQFPSVHIAGTNGKGTSAHALSSILQSAGYSVGLYTSPHLRSFTERIKVSGVPVSEQFVIEFVDKMRSTIEEVEPSFFEVTVAMAFQYFAECKVDIAVVEVGLGGRLDSTNVLTPEVCLITNIGYDHMDILGETLEEIAGEKAGIIKPNTPVVIGSNQPEILHVFEQKTGSENAPMNTEPFLFRLVDTRIEREIRIVQFRKANDELQLTTDLLPEYFIRNVPGILTVINELRIKKWEISDQHVDDGLARIQELSGIKGRFQLLQRTPRVYCDISHNPDGLLLLFDQVLKQNFKTLRIVFGCVRDKKIESLKTILPHNAIYYFTSANNPRSMEAKELGQIFPGLDGDIIPDVNDALNKAIKDADGDDLILVTGSTFVVAELDLL